MMKFFRKNMRYILIALMVLLMIVFVGDVGLERWLAQGGGGSPSGTRAQAYGARVRVSDMIHAGNRLDTLDQLMRQLPPRRPWLYVMAHLGMDPILFVQQHHTTWEAADPIRKAELTIEEWYMLDEAARRSGIYVPSEAVEQFKESWGITPQVIAAIREHRRLSVDEINESLRSFIRVLDYVVLACGGAAASEADIQDFVRKTQERYRITAVVLDAGRFIDQSYEPSAEDIQAHFEAYSGLPPQPGSATQFGYLKQAEVRVEYIRVSAEALAKLISDDAIRLEEAYAYWEQNKSEFLRPAPETQPATDTQPAVEPPKPYETFTEARPQVLAKLRRERARREAIQLARELITRLNRPWDESGRGVQPGEFRQPPESETSDQVYPNLVARYADRYPEVLTFGRTELMDARALAVDPELGRAAAFPRTPQQLALARAAFLVEELLTDPTEHRGFEGFFRSLFQTAPEPFVMTMPGDTQGDAYVMRTVEVLPDRPPATLEEVRDQIVLDLRRKRAYEEAGEKARELIDLAAGGASLETVFRTDGDLYQRLGENAYKEPSPFAPKRIQAFTGMPQLDFNLVPELGFDPALVELCMALAEQYGDDRPRPSRVHEQPGRSRWLAVQFQGTEPITTADYQDQRGLGAFFVRLNRQVDLLRAWFDAEHLRQRAGWEDAPGYRVEDEEASELL